jgi:hypothetical protein
MMQRGIKMVADTSISRCFKTNNQQLKYCQLGSNMFSDTGITFAESPLKEEETSLHKFLETGKDNAFSQWNV